MKQRYNIALRPLTKSAELINLATQYASLAYAYQIGNGSLPHITLCQFLAEPSDIENIWKETKAAITSTQFEIDLIDISHITSAEKNWVSLLPAQTELLFELHSRVTSIIKTPLNRAYRDYDPHLTLFNLVTNFSAEKLLQIKAALPIQDTFILSLGMCDQAGQFIKIIH